MRAEFVHYQFVIILRCSLVAVWTVLSSRPAPEAVVFLIFIGSSSGGDTPFVYLCAKPFERESCRLTFASHGNSLRWNSRIFLYSHYGERGVNFGDRSVQSFIRWANYDIMGKPSYKKNLWSGTSSPEILLCLLESTQYFIIQAQHTMLWIKWS